MHACLAALLIEASESSRIGGTGVAYVPQRSYEGKRTAVAQALQVAVIERAGSELDSEPYLTICWVCFFLTKTYEHEHSKVVKHW